MARVTLSLPAPVIVIPVQVVFGGFQPGATLGDVAALSLETIAFLRLLQVQHSLDIVRLVQVETTTGISQDPDVRGPELTPAWEQSAVAVTLQAPTLPDITIIGPSSPGLDSSDLDEPYSWKLSATQDAATYSNGGSSGIGGWITDFYALTTEQQASVTLILDDGVPVAEDHAVDAGAAAWSFALPEPEVTRTEPAAVDHAVNAGAAAMAWAVPQPSVTHTAAPVDPLVLADLPTPAGRTFLVKMLLEAGTPPSLYRFGSDGSLLDGDDEIATGQDLARILWDGSAFTLNDAPSAESMAAVFASGGAGAAARIHLQTADAVQTFDVADENLLASGGNFVRWDGLPSAFDTLADGIANGDRFILGISVPDAVATDHTVDANAAAWAFAVPEPAVTLTEPVTGDHAVDAGSASWAFAAPEPEVTHTAAPSGDGVSFFDAAVVGDFDDPEVTGSTPGCVLTFAPPVDSNAPILGTSASRRPPRRIPPSWVTGDVDAYWATLQMQSATLVLRTSTSQTSLGVESGPQLTDVAETTLGVALRANDGTEISFLISVLDDSFEPYSRVLNSNSGTGPAFSAAPVSTFSGAEYTACRDAFSSGGGQVVIVDTTHANVDWAAREFASAGEGAATDHAVDAGSAAWAFALPEPGVTRTSATPDDHAVAAGAAAWAFALPEPGVTRTSATPDDHAVAAGAAAWAFALPEPGVTRTSATPDDHAVAAGAAAWAFALPEPGVTRTAPITQDHAVDAGGVAWAFAVAVPSITTSGVAAALDVLVRGLHQDGVQHPSLRVRHSIAKTSTASFVLRGRLDAIPIPAYGDSVEIRDVSGETVFSGFVRAPDPEVADFGAFLDRATVRCQGHNDALRYRRIHGTEGVEIVEADHGADQFSQIVVLLAGYTGATDLDSNSAAIRTDVRYQTAGAVLRALAVANDAILHVTTGRQVRLFQRGNLPASALGRLGAADLFRYSLLRDPRKVRSRQILRYGAAVAQRTINGDGSTREFLVAGTQAAVDYMAAGVAARPLNAQAGDQGLRMRADADSRARPRGRYRLLRGERGRPGLRPLRGRDAGRGGRNLAGDADERPAPTAGRGGLGRGGELRDSSSTRWNGDASLDFGRDHADRRDGRGRPGAGLGCRLHAPRAGGRVCNPRRHRVHAVAADYRE